MKTSLDCIPCFLRQALEAARMVSKDISLHERILREALRWVGELDLNRPAPMMGQLIHRRLRAMVGTDDPYRDAKNHQNRMAQRLFPELKARIDCAVDSLATALRLAIAGNVIDMGANANVTESCVFESIDRALADTFVGEEDAFRKAAMEARSILYLADNAGEIVFDRLLIEQLSPSRVTVAVRGAPVINDATMEDARSIGLHEIVEVIDNGSDAPGTVLDDCSEEFRQRFYAADLILAKGQGNYESLSDDPRNVFFLFKVKCPIAANHAGMPLGAHVLARSRAGFAEQEDSHARI